MVTIGAGLRAQRHNDRVSRWYFVVDGQVGRDFSLLGPDDRPLTKRQLTAELDHLATVLTERPVEHRTAVDARLDAVNESLRTLPGLARPGGDVD